MNEQPGAGDDAAAQPTTTTEPRGFAALGLRPEVLRALDEMGFVEPMEVQRETYARIMAGRDLRVQSRTGSGKTAAFAIPFAQGLIDPERAEVQALVLCPTRELALQVATECTKIGAHRGLKVAAVYGGAPMGRQVEQLRDGAQIVGGTPGRVLDHLRRGTLTLDKLRVLVLDECDEMLSMGFLEEISEILKRCPPSDVRQTLLFSATIPEDIERISARYMRDPEKVVLSADFIGVHQIAHAYYMVSGMGRSRDLVRILAIEKPESAIIFCNTREETSLVAEYLRKSGLDAEAISSDLTQSERERVMGRMRAGNLHYLVATDIAARGIDISDLSHVINYTFPESAEVYVHRTGRTGRAGKSGVAISLIAPRELGNFYYLKLTYKIRPEERTLPTEEEEATRRDGERMERLARELGQRAVAEEWRRLARRAWAADGGEALVAALLEQYFASPGSAPVAAATEGAPSARPERERRSERGRRSERERRPIPREAEPSTEAEPAAEPTGAAAIAPAAVGEAIEASAPVAEGAAAASAGPTERRERRRRRRGRGGGEEAERPAAAAPPAGEASAEEPRGRRRRRRRERGEGRPSSVPSGAPILETSDGREFWEVWADQNASTSAAPSSAAPSGAAPSSAAPSSEPAAEPIEPGVVRLYLNLGRRDGASAEEIERFIADQGVTYRRAQVRNSHTYLFVDEAAAPATIAALTGRRHGDRELVCEPARK